MMINYLERLRRIILLYACGGIFIIYLFSGCGVKKHDPSSVEAAMKYYDHLILNLDADSIALLYTPDGSLGNMARGRDSIRHFLKSFKGVRVLSQASQTSSITISADTAIQKGTYKQIDLVADKDTIVVNGTFTAHWQWLANDGWHIKQMETQSTH